MVAWNPYWRKRDNVFQCVPFQIRSDRLRDTSPKFIQRNAAFLLDTLLSLVRACNGIDLHAHMLDFDLVWVAIVFVSALDLLLLLLLLLLLVPPLSNGTIIALCNQVITPEYYQADHQLDTVDSLDFVAGISERVTVRPWRARNQLVSSWRKIGNREKQNKRTTERVCKDHWLSAESPQGQIPPTDRMSLFIERVLLLRGVFKDKRDFLDLFYFFPCIKYGSVESINILGEHFTGMPIKIPIHIFRPFVHTI